jgi:predicted transcriptional regulator YdeE
VLEAVNKELIAEIRNITERVGELSFKIILNSGRKQREKKIESYNKHNVQCSELYQIEIYIPTEKDSSPVMFVSETKLYEVYGRL